MRYFGGFSHEQCTDITFWDFGLVGVYVPLLLSYLTLPYLIYSLRPLWPITLVCDSAILPCQRLRAWHYSTLFSPVVCVRSSLWFSTLFLDDQRYSTLFSPVVCVRSSLWFSTLFLDDQPCSTLSSPFVCVRSSLWFCTLFLDDQRCSTLFSPVVCVRSSLWFSTLFLDDQRCSTLFSPVIFVRSSLWFSTLFLDDQRCSTLSGPVVYVRSPLWFSTLSLDDQRFLFLPPSMSALSGSGCGPSFSTLALSNSTFSIVPSTDLYFYWYSLNVLARNVYRLCILYSFERSERGEQ